MLSAGVLAGVIIGIALSIGWLVYVSATPAMPVLVRRRGTQVFRPADDSARRRGRTRACSCSASTQDSSSSTPTRSRTGSGSLLIEADPKLQVVVLDFEGVNYIDSQGAEKVGDILDLAQRALARSCAWPA